MSLLQVQYYSLLQLEGGPWAVIDVVVCSSLYWWGALCDENEAGTTQEHTLFTYWQEQPASAHPKHLCGC
jgi:hypothetical protein